MSVCEGAGVDKKREGHENVNLDASEAIRSGLGRS